MSQTDLKTGDLDLQSQIGLQTCVFVLNFQIDLFGILPLHLTVY